MCLWSHPQRSKGHGVVSRHGFAHHVKVRPEPRRLPHIIRSVMVFGVFVAKARTANQVVAIQSKCFVLSSYALQPLDAALPTGQRTAVPPLESFNDILYAGH